MEVERERERGERKAKKLREGKGQDVSFLVVMSIWEILL